VCHNATSEVAPGLLAAILVPGPPSARSFHTARGFPRMPTPAPRRPLLRRCVGTRSTERIRSSGGSSPRSWPAGPDSCLLRRRHSLCLQPIRGEVEDFLYWRGHGRGSCGASTSVDGWLLGGQRESALFSLQIAPPQGRSSRGEPSKSAMTDEAHRFHGHFEMW